MSIMPTAINQIETAEAERQQSIFMGGTLKTSDRKSTRLNSSHDQISYAVFCLKKKKKRDRRYEKRARGERQVADGPLPRDSDAGLAPTGLTNGQNGAREAPASAPPRSPPPQRG